MKEENKARVDSAQEKKCSKGGETVVESCYWTISWKAVSGQQDMRSGRLQWILRFYGIEDDSKKSNSRLLLEKEKLIQSIVLFSKMEDFK